MKKFVKLFILSVICILPVMVDAKANFEFKEEYPYLIFLSEKNGEYFYLDVDSNLNQAGSVVVLDENGEFLREDKFFEGYNELSPITLPNSKFFESYYKLYIEDQNGVYDEEDEMLYSVFYSSESLGYYDSDENFIEQGFNDDLEFTKRLLGKKYDVYLNVKEYDVEVNNIVENNGYYIVHYNDSEYNEYVSVLDKDFKIVKTFENDVYCLYIYDDLIYAMTNPTAVDIYKLDGSLFETLSMSDISLDSTDGLAPYKLYIKNNELFVMYDSHQFIDNARDVDFMGRLSASYDPVNCLTLVYTLNYDVEKAEPNNGEFTYTSKVDDEGKEYIELKITPEEGYSVEEIIVTDINGKRLEVTNNKFYMPTSDVKIEVKFTNGEYLPIPNTFSEISPMFKIIAVLLIGCGMCIMCFNLKSKRAN